VRAALRNELRKIFWRKKYCVMLAVYAAIGLAVGALGASGLNLRAVMLLSPSAARQGVAFGALSACRSVLLPLAVFMLAADSVTHELESKSIKCVLTRPVSRFDAYLAKSLAILCYVAVSLAACFAVAAAWQMFVPGFSGANGAVAPGSAAYAAGISRSGAGAPSASALAEAFAAYALTLVPMAAFVSLATFIATLVKSPALVMFLCIASYGALAFAGTFLNGVGAALFTTYTSWYRMWLGYRLPWRSLLSAVGLLCSTCVIFFGLGYLIFERKDI
jgi:ABC-2 type transport system permease protein